MKKWVMKKWVKELRSGEYEQGSNQLVTERFDGTEAFCCLGVLCNIATEHGYGKWVNEGLFEDEQGDKSGTNLTNGVVEWAGMKTKNGSIEGEKESLISLNDSSFNPHDFNAIADIIEKRYKEL